MQIVKFIIILDAALSCPKWQRELAWHASCVPPGIAFCSWVISSIASDYLTFHIHPSQLQIIFLTFR